MIYLLRDSLQILSDLKCVSFAWHKEEKEERERGGKGNIDFIGFVEEGDRFNKDRSHTNQSLDRRTEQQRRTTMLSARRPTPSFPLLSLLSIFSQALHFFFGAAPTAAAPKNLPPFISPFSEAEESITGTNRSVAHWRGNEVLARNDVALTMKFCSSEDEDCYFFDLEKKDIVWCVLKFILRN